MFANSDLKHWKENSLIEKTDFRKENTSYLRIKKTTNTYLETVYPEEKLWGLHAGKLFFKSPQEVIDAVTGQPVPTYRYSQSGCSPDGLDVFRFADYTISIGKKELVCSIDSLFFDNGSSLQTITDYTYNTNHLLSTTKVKTSSNDTLTTEQKYPFDFPSDAVCVEMANRNMLNYPMEINTYKNSSTLTGSRTAFKDWGNNCIKPEIISVKQSTNPYEARLVFHSYDAAGNVQCVSKVNDTKITYLYGYNNEFPIAEIINASPDQVFYTSFEDDEGNSSENNSKTGRKSRIGGYSRTLSGLANGNYRLSYFENISGNWIPVEINNILVSTGTFTINISGQIDELRFYPEGSTMKTYTYDVLTGVTSVTDQDQVSNYYEYDAFGRLERIRDENQNIVKANTYHYKEQ